VNFWLVDHSPTVYKVVSKHVLFHRTSKHIEYNFSEIIKTYFKIIADILKKIQIIPWKITNLFFAVYTSTNMVVSNLNWPILANVLLYIYSPHSIKSQVCYFPQFRKAIRSQPCFPNITPRTILGIMLPYQCFWTCCYIFNLHILLRSWFAISHNLERCRGPRPPFPTFTLCKY
jgi:hypothetical protein